MQHYLSGSPPCWRGCLWPLFWYECRIRWFGQNSPLSLGPTVVFPSVDRRPLENVALRGHKLLQAWLPVWWQRWQACFSVLSAVLMPGSPDSWGFLCYSPPLSQCRCPRERSILACLCSLSGNLWGRLFLRAFLPQIKALASKLVPEAGFQNLLWKSRAKYLCLSTCNHPRSPLRQHGASSWLAIGQVQGNSERKQRPMCQDVLSTQRASRPHSSLGSPVQWKEGPSGSPRWRWKQGP